MEDTNEISTPHIISSPPPNQSPSTPAWTSILLTVVVFAWIVLGMSLSAGIFWFIEEIQSIEDVPMPIFVRPIFSMVQFAFLAVPLLPLAIWWKHPRYQAVFQTWALAAGYGLLMLPVRFISASNTYAIAFWQIAGNLIYLALILSVLGLRQRQGGAGFIKPRRPYLLALLLAPIFIYSWLAVGAVGSWLELLLQAIAALLFGINTGILLGHFLLRPLSKHITTIGWNVTFGGFVAGATLLIMSLYFAVGGQALLLALSLPSLGWVLLGMSRLGVEKDERSWFSLALFIAIVTTIQTAFVDIDELALVLNFGSNDILYWSALATGWTIVMGWTVGLVLTALRHFLPQWGSRRVIVAGSVFLWTIAGILYITVGQPGFYGEHVLVIMADQKNLSNAQEIDNIVVRRNFVYEELVNHANTTQADIRQTLDSLHVSYKPYYLVNALEVNANPVVRFWLASRSDVDRIIDNPTLRPLPQLPPISSGEAEVPNTPDWNLTMIGADRVWNELGVTGKGIIIGHSDSGVQWDHPELQDSYRGSVGEHDYNWFDPWYNAQEPTDIGGHGTHTLGSILGNHVGVAPDATWFACANLVRNLANPALYLDCMQFMLAPFPLNGDPFTDGDTTRGAHVLNNSWGCPELEGCDANSLLEGVRNLRYAGIFVAVSAGNSGPNCSSVNDPLAIYDESFSVGAVDSTGQLTNFSSRGPVTVDGSNRLKPDISAPGDGVLSAYPNSSYEYASGTSMAGPHVAGVVALMWSANPDLIGNIDKTEAILRETAQPYNTAKHLVPNCGGEELPNNAVGYGIVDAFAAVSQAMKD